MTRPTDDQFETVRYILEEHKGSLDDAVACSAVLHYLDKIRETCDEKTMNRLRKCVAIFNALEGE